MKKLILLTLLLFTGCHSYINWPIKVTDKYQREDKMCSIFIRSSDINGKPDDSNGIYHWTTYSYDNCKYEIGQEIK